VLVEVFLYLAERLYGRGLAQHRLGDDGVELFLHEVILRRIAHVETKAGDLLLQVHQLLRWVLLDRLEVEVLVIYDLEAVLVLGNFGTDLVPDSEPAQAETASSRIVTASHSQTEGTIRISTSYRRTLRTGPVCGKPSASARFQRTIECGRRLSAFARESKERAMRCSETAGWPRDRGRGIRI